MFTPEIIVNYNNTFLKCPFKPKIKKRKKELGVLYFFQIYL